MQKITRKEFVRRSAGVAALAGLGVGGLSACGGQEGGTQSGSQSGGNGEPVTIEYWHVNDESFGGPAIERLVALFQEQNPNITVEQRYHENVYTGLLENLQTALAANRPPDVAQLGYLYLDYVNNNLPFVPVDELNSRFGEDAYFDAFPENILALGQQEGAQIGMPYSISNILCYYNADMLSEAGLNEAPATWEDWRVASEEIKGATGKPGIYVQIIDDNWSTEAMIESNGGQLLACQSGESMAAFDEPRAVEAVRFWADLVEDDLALNVLWDQGEQAFLSGEVATFFTTIGKRGNLQGQANFDLRGAPFPRFGDREPSLPAGGNNLFVFSEDEAKQRAAWEFIKFLESARGISVWTRETGYLPPREGVAEDPAHLAEFIDENQIQAVAVEQTDLVGPWQSWPGPNGLQASQRLFDGFQEALGGGPVDEALGAAADDVDGLISGQSCER